MNEQQVLSSQQMKAAEQALFDSGTSVLELMEIAAGGAAEWVRRIAASRPITVLCGPGNNGGDGYVIARRLHESGNTVRVIAPIAPKTEAAKSVRKLWTGSVETSDKGAHGEVLVDCLFGTGLARPLEAEHALLLRDLAERHAIRVAIDLPSGMESDTGALLNDRLPIYTATIALGAWKYAHWSLPAREKMGPMRLVPIGIKSVHGAAEVIAQPQIKPPPVNAHKYSRGMLAVIGGVMPGASILSAEAAQRSGAGYVKLFTDTLTDNISPGIVTETAPLTKALGDKRIKALLVGPGLGRKAQSSERLMAALNAKKPSVLDADALELLKPDMLERDLPILATPHDGEFETLCRSFSVISEQRKDRALALARASGMVVCAKGPNTIIAAPDGRLALAAPASSWLSVAGTGDVLAGIAASRMAAGEDAFAAGCQAVWLHSEAARLCGPAFTADELARRVSRALAKCL